jgi:transposase
LGLDAKIFAANHVAPYRLEGKGGKNDANDAAAICEAASRPSLRFVPVKTLSQQGMLCVHRCERLSGSAQKWLLSAVLIPL